MSIEDLANGLRPQTDIENVSRLLDNLSQERIASPEDVGIEGYQEKISINGQTVTLTGWDHNSPVDKDYLEDVDSESSIFSVSSFGKEFFKGGEYKKPVFLMLFTIFSHDVIEVNSFYVNKALRGNGIGRKLYGSLIKVLKENGVKIVIGFQISSRAEKFFIDNGRYFVKEIPNSILIAVEQKVGRKVIGNYDTIHFLDSNIDYALSYLREKDFDTRRKYNDPERMRLLRYETFQKDIRTLLAFLRRIRSHPGSVPVEFQQNVIGVTEDIFNIPEDVGIITFLEGEDAQTLLETREQNANDLRKMVTEILISGYHKEV